MDNLGLLFCYTRILVSFDASLFFPFQPTLWSRLRGSENLGRGLFYLKGSKYKPLLCSEDLKIVDLVACIQACICVCACRRVDCCYCLVRSVFTRLCHARQGGKEGVTSWRWNLPSELYVVVTVSEHHTSTLTQSWHSSVLAAARSVLTGVDHKLELYKHCLVDLHSTASVSAFSHDLLS